MKRILMVILMTATVCSGVFAQNKPTIYVSAKGNDTYTNDENNPCLTMSHAIALLTMARMVGGMDINTITVIGTLDARSEGTKEDANSIFPIFSIDDEAEIVITGKPGAIGVERAVLSARGTEKGVVITPSGRIRFEHIEISGGNLGISIREVSEERKSRVTLGPGAVIRGNSRYGVGIIEGTLIIDGGEIRDNTGTGVLIYKGAVLTMRNGTIRDNRSSDDSGGVHVGGTFSMYGGTITGNRAASTGGGVYVTSTGTFNQTGGTISNNTSQQSPNIYRASGSKGTNL